MQIRSAVLVGLLGVCPMAFATDVFELGMAARVTEVSDPPPGLPWSAAAVGDSMAISLCVSRAAHAGRTLDDGVIYVDAILRTAIDIAGAPEQLDAPLRDDFTVINMAPPEPDNLELGAASSDWILDVYLAGSGNLWDSAAIPSCDQINAPDAFDSPQGIIYFYEGGYIAFAITTVACGETPPCGVVCSHCPADFNSDGGVDGSDVEAFFSAWESGQSCADVNRDGGVDGPDVERFFVLWERGDPHCCASVPQHVGDYDGNGILQVQDRGLFLEDLSLGRLRADVSCDGRVDGDDLAVFDRSFCDWNQDGQLTCDDECAVIRAIIAGDHSVDFNGDGFPDASDLTDFDAIFSTVYTGPSCAIEIQNCP